MRTLELCTIAVEENGYALEYVPKKLKSMELCLLAIETSDKAGVLRYIPKKLINLELCRMSISSTSGYFLKDVPKRFRTIEICTIAVKNNPLALEFVPESILLSVASTVIEELHFSASFLKPDSQ
ncbi:MAG: DUF4116 domain-containing protein [Mariprofundaceae bacterium]|nr:DUF4116 domain-containing protein [Mariprofundaceae bacterium]